MKMKRFLAPNMREALRAVRTEQGPDAVILSNRRVGDYIEVIAALDYDEALIKQALHRNTARRASAQSDVDPRIDDTLDHESDKTVTTDQPEPTTKEHELHQLIATAEHAPETVTTRRSQDTHITEFELTDTPPQLGALHEQLAEVKSLLASQVGQSRWQRLTTDDPERAQILRNYTQLGICDDVASRLASESPGTQDGSRQPWREPVAAIAKHLPVATHHVLNDGGIAAVVGPTGVGKTTTIAKLATQFALQYGSRDIALISMDNYRIGAREQLRQFGRIINAAVYEARDHIALRALLPQLDHYRLILIDTAGVSQRDARLAEMLDGLANQRKPVALYLAMSATVDAHLADEIIRCYQQVPVSACVLTKIDEASRLGAPLSALIRHELPLAFVCDGQHVPDDLHIAASKRLWLVNRALEYAHESRFKPEEQHMAESFGLREVVNG
ncbi:MAG: flagellar biosynthesis protein FlhF [Pseudomonadota bacterium]